MATLVEELQQTVSAIAGTVGPSVVRIGRGPGRGAGVVIAPNRVLTNAHNLRGHETTVAFPDGRSETATLAGSDADGDLAVLTVDTGDVPPLRWDPTSVEPSPGTPVFAVVNRAGSGVRVTFGLVSAIGQAFAGPRGRSIGGSIEHTAPLGRGSSGGPIVDAAGSLVGINTNRIGDGFYLAIPADADLRRRVDALAAGESRARPRLGVALAPAHAARRLRAAVGLPERDGLLIRGVQDPSPASRAGLRQGDLIVEAAGLPVTAADELYDALDTAAGGVLTLKVVRGTDELDIEVSFAPETETPGDPA